jgi:pimeloyl-ACP methyl ester carboxylesterase
MSSQIALTQKQVKLGDFTLKYLEAGTASATAPIVLLHGWGISAEPYREIVSQLAQRHRIIAPDLPGFADSREFGLIDSYDRYAQILLAFLAALGIETAHFIGHSLGGGIGITIAATAPERVESLILVDSTGSPAVSWLEIPFRRAIEMVLQISPSKLYLQFMDIPRVFVPNLLLNPQNVLQGLFLSLQVDLHHLLPKIESPCLLLWSKQDLTTPLASAQTLHQQIRSSQLVLVEEGFHEWTLWYPEKFAAIVLNFIDSVTAQKAEYKLTY